MSWLLGGGNLTTFPLALSTSKCVCACLRVCMYDYHIAVCLRVCAYVRLFAHMCARACVHACVCVCACSVSVRNCACELLCVLVSVCVLCAYACGVFISACLEKLHVCAHTLALSFDNFFSAWLYWRVNKIVVVHFVCKVLKL